MTLLRPRPILLTAILFVVAVLSLAGAALSDDRDDHERARRAFEAGEIMSLSRILENVKRDFDGELIEVELEDEDRRGFVYEVKLLTRDGAIVELLYDAQSGELIRSEGGKHDDEKDD